MSMSGTDRQEGDKKKAIISSRLSLVVSLLCGSCGLSNPDSLVRSDNAFLEQPVQNGKEVTDSLCGKTTASRNIERYFDQVAQFVQHRTDPILLRSLVSEEVIIIRRGRSRVFSGSAFVREGLRFISVEDWSEISRRGVAALESGGWRGCFLSHGKAAFQIDAERRLRLSSFNMDMPWTAVPDSSENINSASR